MRVLFVFVALAAAACGCGGRSDRPNLEPLARGLSEALRTAYADFGLEVRATDDGSHVTLHCVLKNVSVAARTIEVDASTLPWLSPGDFDINAVAANGDVVHRNPPPAVLMHIQGPPTPLSIASGGFVEGAMELEKMPIAALPRQDDLLLLWSTSIREFNADSSTVLQGATFLKAASAVAEKPSSSLAPEVPKSLPESSIAGTYAPTRNLDAPDSAVVGGTVVRLQVFASEDHMPMAAIQDPNSGLRLPDPRKMAISFRLISEHGAPLSTTTQAQRLSIFQDGKVWQTSAIEETLGAADRSSRNFVVHDGPTGHSRTPIDVVVELRDDKGGRYVLALRNQPVGALQ